MKNKDLFIKYLDGELSISDKYSFDKKLLEEPNFKDDFLKFIELYNMSKEKIEFDDRYFSNLIPRAKKRVEKSKRKSYAKYTVAFPIAALVTLFLLKSGEKDNTNNLMVALETFTNDTTLVEELYSNLYNIEGSIAWEDKLVSMFLEDYFQLDETVFDHLEEDLSLNDVNDNLLDNLSQNEFDDLYEKLIDKKIL